MKSTKKRSVYTGERKQYKEESKRKSVQHSLQIVKAVARELGISVNILHGGVKRYKKEPKNENKERFILRSIRRVCRNSIFEKHSYPVHNNGLN